MWGLAWRSSSLVLLLTSVLTALLVDVGESRLLNRRVQARELSPEIIEKLNDGKRLNRRERAQVRNAEQAKYLELRSQGFDEVSNTKEAAALRSYRLRSKKQKGLLRKHQASLADVLFPGVSPNEYMDGEPIFVYTDLAESKRAPIPFEYYDLPATCPAPTESKATKRFRQRKNLGSRLQGHDFKPAPFSWRVKRNEGCTVICVSEMRSKQLKRMRKLILREYRVQLSLDQMPVLVRNKEYNFALRGYPLGFRLPAGAKSEEPYLFNHLKFVVTYHEDPSLFSGVRITGFDVHPVSVQHDLPTGGSTSVSTCQGQAIENEPENFLSLRTPQSTAGSLPVVYSYEVEWVPSSLQWTDRWDVYLVGAPDDNLHYLSIVNSLMVVLFMTIAIATIMVRTLRKDIDFYNELDALNEEEEAAEEKGWKLIHGDVFRPPATQPMTLCVLVGNGCQLGMAFGLSMIAATLGLLNPVQKGQTLTALILLYVLCGSVAGYVSCRLYKFTDQTSWEVCVLMTATALPGCLVLVFSILNIFLSVAGAATAVSFLTIAVLFLLWVGVSVPLVLLGAYFGQRADKIHVPTKTSQIARVVPSNKPCHARAPFTIPVGGILPFGSAAIELAFIMSALWMHQIYYLMGFLLAVLLIVAATCGQVSVVLTYLQLCAEDHRWWWVSFWNSASAGVYLFLYSVWFLAGRLQMVGLLPVVVYLTYMGMISICFGLVCGSLGFLSSLWFTRTIYGSVKVD